MQILSKKAFRFIKPGADILKPLGNKQDDKQPAVQEVGKQQDFDKIYFETVPNSLQQAPNWIIGDTTTAEGQRNRLTFMNAVKDGDLMEIVTRDLPSDKEMAVQAALAQASDAKDRLEQKQQILGEEELGEMTKDQLAQHAADNHGLELPSTLKKSEMVDAILAAQSKAEGAL